MSAPLRSTQFALDVAQREAELLRLINERARPIAERLAEDPDIKVLRIAKCHGQLAALVECLGPDGLGLFNAPTIDVAIGHVWQMARERQQAINAASVCACRRPRAPRPEPSPSP